MSAALTDPIAVNTYGDPRTKNLLKIGLYVAMVPFFVALLGYNGALGGRALGGWLAFGLVFGPFFALSVAYIVVTYRRLTPGIKNDGTMAHPLAGRRVSAYLLGALLTSLYILLYWFGGALQGLIEVMEPLSQLLRKGPADQWFFYGFVYTAAVCIMGVRMLYRYRHNKYQIFRTLSVMFFQLAFAFILPGLLKAFHQPEFYFTYFWPLKADYLFPSSFEWLWNQGHMGMFMFGWGVIASFVLTPLLTWRFGKRWYCSWVCGCGGLAETAGDPFRQLSSKTLAAWKFERWAIHTVLVVITVVTALLWVDLGAFSNDLKAWYGFFVGAALSGVVGVGFYPLLGSRVWCRFFCPMAAILGIFQRFYSRFRITTNGAQCIACGNCSHYCEMGIDVRAYAMTGKSIVRASCVGCGVCAAVCPRGVLKLENGPTHKDRFDGAAHPLADLLGALKKR